MEASTRIRTIVCDDEPDAREGIVAMLRGDPDVAVVGEARTGEEAAEMIMDREADLVFLDIQMPRLDGFGVIERVGPDRLPVVVFVTAFDQYALKAFEVRALDYLLKPFTDERFEEALARAKAQVHQRRARALSQELASLLVGHVAIRRNAGGARAEPPPARGVTLASTPAYLEHFLVRLAGTVTLVRVEDVDWIEADDYYAKLHASGRTHLIRETMQRLEAKLDPHQFVRVHRSAIVRIDRVHTMHPYFKGSHLLVLRDGTRVTLSRSRRPAFEAAVGGRV